MLDAIRARAAQAGVNVHQDTGPAPKLAVVAVGETSYTHATSWVKEQPYLPADQLALIQDFQRQGIPWSWCSSCRARTSSPGGTTWPAPSSSPTEGARRWDRRSRACPSATTPRRASSRGNCPRSLNDVLRSGGTDIPADATENWDLPYGLGATAAQRAEIRAKMDANQPVPSTYGNPLYPFGAGLTNW